MRVWRSSGVSRLRPRPAELDHDLVGAERRDDIAAQRRAAQVEVHAREQVDHVPLVRRQVRERQRGAALEAFVLVVLHLERADHDVAVIERLVLAREVGVVEAGHAVMVVHEVVIEFAVGVVPELVVRVARSPCDSGTPRAARHPAILRRHSNGLPAHSSSDTFGLSSRLTQTKPPNFTSQRRRRRPTFSLHSRSW